MFALATPLFAFSEEDSIPEEAADLLSGKPALFVVVGFTDEDLSYRTGIFDILPALKGEDSTVGVRLRRFPGGNLRVCMLLVGTVSAW